MPLGSTDLLPRPAAKTSPVRTPGNSFPEREPAGLSLSLQTGTFGSRGMARCCEMGRTPLLSCPRPNRTKSVPNRGQNAAFSGYFSYLTSLESTAGRSMASV